MHLHLVTFVADVTNNRIQVCTSNVNKVRKRPSKNKKAPNDGIRGLINLILLMRRLRRHLRA